VSASAVEHPIPNAPLTKASSAARPVDRIAQPPFSPALDPVDMLAVDADRVK
jgi:hypothetical protein